MSSVERQLGVDLDQMERALYISPKSSPLRKSSVPYYNRQAGTSKLEVTCRTEVFLAMKITFYLAIKNL